MSTYYLLSTYTTEKVALMLKGNGVKGGSLSRLLDDEEYRLYRKGPAAARRKIKGLQIYL